MAEVDSLARSSLREQQQQDLPYLSRMRLGSNSLSLLGLGSTAHASAVGLAPGGLLGSSHPRIQESRTARRQAVGPLAVPSPSPSPRCAPVDRRRFAQEATPRPKRAGTPDYSLVGLPPVGATPTTTDAMAAGAQSDDTDMPVSQDEAANLLLALPMSREPSGLDTLAALSPRAAPAVPMSKSISGLSVGGCLSLLDVVESEGVSSPMPSPPVPSPRSGRTGRSPRPPPARYT